MTLYFELADPDPLPQDGTWSASVMYFNPTVANVIVANGYGGWMINNPQVPGGLSIARDVTTGQATEQDALDAAALWVASNPPPASGHLPLNVQVVRNLSYPYDINAI